MKKLLWCMVTLTPLFCYTQNVGVGTTAPEMKLHVVNAGSGVFLLENTTSLALNVTTDMYFRIGTEYAGAIKSTGENATDARLGFFTNAGSTTGGLIERISILNNGNVGIGTALPDASLHISEKINNNSSASLKISAHPSEFDIDGASELIIDGFRGNIGADAGSIKFDLRGNNGAQISARVGTTNSIANGANLIFSTSPDATGMTESMRITNMGNVGVGTITPTARLDVDSIAVVGDIIVGTESDIQTASNATGQGFLTTPWLYTNAIEAQGERGAQSTLITIGDDGNLGAADEIHLVTNGTTNLVVKSTGYIGIGTTTPATLLDLGSSGTNYINTTTSVTGITSTAKTIQVYDQSQSVLNLVSNANSADAVLGGVLFSRASGDANSHRNVAAITALQTGTGSLSGAHLLFYTKQSEGAVERIRITNMGNVGIGLNSPSEKLHVNGNLKVAGIISGVTDPITGQDAATKAYVDLISSPCGLSIGDTYAGGIIFYLDASGCHGLVAAASDQSTGIQWYNGDFVDTYAYGNGIGAGEGNSQGIRRWQGTCSSCYASELCQELSLEGYSDWYLPSKYELNLMYENIGQGNSLGLGNVGGFSSDGYWSSTEIDIFPAWLQFFNTSGNQVRVDKFNTASVRAVRAF